MAAAISAIPGGTGPYLIRVMAGTYSEPVFSFPSNVTLRGAGRDCTFLVVNGGITMSQPNAMITGFSIVAGVTISVSNVTLSDNDITTSSGDAVDINGGGIRPIIHNCKIHDCEGWGIKVQNGAQPFIHDNYITDNSSGGVLYYEAGGNLSNNKISYSGFPAGPGVQLTGAICPPYKLIIDDNQIQSNSVGIDDQWHCFDPRIVGNDISSNMNAGIAMQGYAHIVANIISYNYQGIYLNNSEAEEVSHIIGNNIWSNQIGIDCANGAKGIVSSNLMAPNFSQDINYPGTNPNVTFNNNTFDTTVGVPSAPGQYNADSNGNPISP